MKKEMGKPLSESIEEVEETIESINTWAKQAD